MTISIINNLQTDYSQLLEISEHRLILERELVKESNLDVRDKKGRNALYWAIKTSHKHNTELLLEYGISLMVQPNLHALFHSIQSNYLDLFSYFLKSGQNINMQNTKKQSLLMVAIESKNMMMIRYLVSHGINLQIKDINGETAFEYAQKSKNKMIYDIIHYKLLLQKMKNA